jgi:hypothetical protein
MMHTCPHSHRRRAPQHVRVSPTRLPLGNTGGQTFLSAAHDRQECPPHGEMPAHDEMPAPDSDPFLTRAIILRAWVAVADAAEARAFLARHTARLCDPRTIALLTGWARQTDDPALVGELLRRRAALLGHCPL